MRKSLIILPCITLLFPVSVAADGTGDNSLVQQMQYGDFNYLHNVESGSLNPVSISGMPLSQLAIISAGYQWSEGDYHNVDASGHTDGFSVDAYGLKRIKEFAFEGGIAYYNHNDRARCWNSTLFQDKLNPFILADFEPSDYNTERFRVNGRMSYAISPRFRFGINADYHAGVMSDEKDPRVETKGMRFILNPGVQWDVTPRLAIGATGGINLFNESSRYSCVATAVNFKFYLMSGLGTYFPQTGSSYTRDAKGTSWFAAIDLRYRFSSTVDDYLYVSYGRHNESAIDGGSTYRFKGGDYLNDVISVHNRLSIKNASIAHNIGIRLETNAVKGKWFDQRSVTENGTTRYEVMNASVKHKESYLQGTASYRFDLLDGAGTSSLTAGAAATVTVSDTKNYPDLQFRKYTRIDITANVIKHFRIRKVYLGAGIDGGYGTKLSSSCRFAGLELERDYALPMYDYLTSSAFTVNGRIQAKIPVGEFILGAYIAGGTTHCIAAKYGYDGRSLNSINCGISMAF